MPYRYLLVVFCVTVFFSAKGQNSAADPVRFVIPAPDALALGKYGNTPVSMYTGTANISIPIYTVKEGMIELPIALNYNTGGVKVADVAPWTGTGWTLSGASITRVVYGAPDEIRLNSDEKSIDFNPNKEKMEAYMNNSMDSQQDVFYFNFNGRSGRFVLNDNFEPQVTPYQKLKITATKQASVSFVPDGTRLAPRRSVTEWEVVDEGGFVYTFSAIEKSQAYSRFYSYGTGTSGGSGNFGSSGTGDPSLWNYSVSAWNLTKVTSPVGDEITLVYADREVQYDTPCEASKYILLQLIYNVESWVKTGTISSQRMFHSTKRLSEIRFSNGKLVFEESLESRADLIGDKYLQRVVLKNSAGDDVRRFTLKYKYLLSNGDMVEPNTINTTNELNFFDYPPGDTPSAKRRLMLLSVTECGADDNECRSHQLKYYVNSGLPSRYSSRTDHWGFFNNYQPTDPNSILPEFKRTAEHYVIYGKDASQLYASEGSLKQVIYPTGGSTTFNYELNDCITKFLPNPIRDKPGVSLNIFYDNYNNLNYPYETGHSPVYDEVGLRKLYYQPFTIDDLNGGLNLVMQVDNFLENPGVFGYYIINEATGAVAWYMDHNFLSQLNYSPANHTFSGSASVALANGNYRLYHSPPRTFTTDISSSSYIHPYQFSILGWKEEMHVDWVTTNRNIGGLRVSSIVDYDPFEKRSLKKTYRYVQDDGSLTSGEMMSDFSYVYDYTELATYTVGIATGSEELHYKVFKSSPVSQLLSTQGSHVGYSRVEVVEGELNGPTNGKTVYRYRSPNLFPDHYSTGNSKLDINPFPFAPADNFDWMRGQVLEEWRYRYNSQRYDILYYRKNIYSHPQGQPNGVAMKSFKCDYRKKAAEPNPYILGGEHILTAIYYFTVGYVNLESTEEWDYSGDAIRKKITNYGYSTLNLQNNYSKTTNSEGHTIENEIKFSSDYDGLSVSDSVSLGVKNLVDRHMINNEIENSQYITKAASSKKLLSSVFNIYRAQQPVVSQVLQIDNAEVLTDFSPSTVQAGVISRDARYVQKLIFDAYGSKGSILQYHKANDVNHAYLWDSKRRFPIAHAINAVWNQIFFTGFEETGVLEDASATAKTGARYWNSGSFNFSGNAGFSPANPTQLVMSYWYWDGAWQFSGVIPFTNTIARGQRLDDIRVYPPTAQFTTYTYDELNGMTSATDANQKSTYYSYDGLGRLKYIRDNDKAITKKLEYHYAADLP